MLPGLERAHRAEARRASRHACVLEVAAAPRDQDQVAAVERLRREPELVHQRVFVVEQVPARGVAGAVAARVVVGHLVGGVVLVETDDRGPSPGLGQHLVLDSLHLRPQVAPSGLQIGMVPVQARQTIHGIVEQREREAHHQRVQHGHPGPREQAGEGPAR